MRSLPVVLIVALLFGLPVLAAPAQASLPVTVGPFTVDQRRSDVSLTWVQDGIYAPGTPYIGEYCFKERIFCIGPYEMPPRLLVSGQWGAEVTVEHANASATWNQSRETIHGPYNVDLPILGRIPFCTWGCTMPNYANSTLNATATVGVYAGGYTSMKRTVVSDFNSTSPQSTRFEVLA